MPPGARGNFVFSQTKNFFLCSFRGELGKVMSLCLSTEACSLSEVCEAGFLNLPGSDVRGLGEMVLLVPCSKGGHHAHKVGIGVTGREDTLQPQAKRTAGRKQWDLMVLCTFTGGHSDSPKHPLKIFPQIIWSAAGYETEPWYAIS